MLPGGWGCAQLPKGEQTGKRTPVGNFGGCRPMASAWFHVAFKCLRRGTLRGVSFRLRVVGARCGQFRRAAVRCIRYEVDGKEEQGIGSLSQAEE